MGKKRAVYVQAALATIQFGMLHVLIYKTDIVPVILCWCAVWCVMSKKKNRLMVCEGRGGENVWCEREGGR